MAFSDFGLCSRRFSALELCKQAARSGQVSAADLLRVITPSVPRLSSKTCKSALVLLSTPNVPNGQLNFVNGHRGYVSARTQPDPGCLNLQDRQQNYLVMSHADHAPDRR